MTHVIKSPRKLIEVALPLDAINESASREKSIRHGHPSTLHLWWARRPLAAARAVLFGQLVNDPSWRWDMEHPGEIPPSHLRASWAATRKRLFGIIEELVTWKNTNNPAVLERARAEIRKSWIETCDLNKEHPLSAELFNRDKLPPLHDPFAGGGTIPLEAQRLGLESYASDLNPVAVLINKAMIEVPPKFQGQPPVNPEWQLKGSHEKAANVWLGAQGLAADVSHYGQWIRTEAEKRIGYLYPPVKVTAEMAKERPDLRPLVGDQLTVIAWLWARTVNSPNPAFANIKVPLTSTFLLSTKRGQEAYVDPVMGDGSYRFTVKVGKPKNALEAKDGTKLSGANFRCIMSGSPIDTKYIRAEAIAGRMGARLMAVIAEGDRGRVYLSPQEEMEVLAQSVSPIWKPDLKVPTPCHDVDRLPMYGMPTWGDAFDRRQVVALVTFADLVSELHKVVENDARAAGLSPDTLSLNSGGSGAVAYADAIALYVGLGVGRSANYWSSFTPWAGDFIVQTFGRQAIRMVWDHAEVNPFSSSTGNWSGAIDWISKVIATSLPASPKGVAQQADAQGQSITSGSKIVSTDPPYYDNISYADLSDFFYVWLRRTLRPIFPDLFATLAVPKAEELVATPYRHGTKQKAEAFFLAGMTQAMHRLAEQAHAAFPVTIYYAFKQSETQGDGGTTSTGWETFLDAVLRAGFAVTGTWPMRTERDQGLKTGTNVLASSIILVCRPRATTAPTISRRAFIRELNQVLPEALDEMTRGADGDRSPVAPVDLSQAIIGPGMAVFSKYASVLEADGTPMTVKTALTLINRFLAEDDFDAETQLCLHWFEQHGWNDGKFGEADTLARAKGTSVDGVKQSGVLYASAGVVRLLRWVDYPSVWDPKMDSRLPIWEVLHQLIRVFKSDGETGAGAVLGAVQAKAEAARQLAYRLYTLCERAGWAEDARAYNELITSWSAIEAAAAQVAGPRQTDLFRA